MEKQKVDWSQFSDADDPTDEEINVGVWGWKDISITPTPTDREILGQNFGYDIKIVETMTDADCERLCDKLTGWNEEQ